MARGLPAAPPRGRPGLAGEAGLGDGDRAGRRGPRGPGAPAGRRVEPGGTPPAGGLVRRPSRRRRDPNGVRWSGSPTAIPADGAAFDRLAELAVREGQPARAAELRRRKAEIDQLKLNTRSSSSATSRCATRPRWPAWRSNWVTGSRPRSSRAWRWRAEPARDDLRAALARWSRDSRVRRWVRTDSGRCARLPRSASLWPLASPARPISGPGRLGRLRSSSRTMPPGPA